MPRTVSRALPAALNGLRVLFVSALHPQYYGAFRLATLRRLGLADVSALDQQAYTGSGVRGKLQFRLQMGSEVRRFNRDVVAAAEEHQPHVAWFDKALGLWPETLTALRGLGVVSIDYVNDNCFGPRRDPGWRVYRKALPFYDLHAVPRAASVVDYQAAGARQVMQVRFTYEPTVHFAPPAEWDDRERDREVSFIGTPYDERAGFLSRLAKAGLPLTISGSEPHWRAALDAATYAAAFRGGELKADAYREAIWRSKVNLAFVTKANVDDVAHKAFEITACGGFLLAERTPEHLACFREDEEAVFFSSEEECLRKARQYLADESARERIAQAGLRRAQSSGYDNDSMMRAVLTRAMALGVR